MKRFFFAAVFAACMIAAPIFTEAIAAPVDQAYTLHDEALPAAPADNLTATPVRFCAVTVRSSNDQDQKSDTIASVRYHIRC